MCIAYLAISVDPRWPLFIAANRDEFHARPCLPAAPWPHHPDIISGIDVQGGGTWLGLTRQGRYALITNYRDPSVLLSDAPSRGALVSNYLAGTQTPLAYASQVQAQGGLYNGFNLIVGDRRQACYIGNRSEQNRPMLLAPGRYVLSNHLLDTPWPKSQRLRQALDTLSFDGLDQSLSPIFDVLRDTTTAPDHDLPNTGLALDRERLLSSPFIVSDTYGTRCSTVIAVPSEGASIFSETSYDAQGRQVERHDWSLLTDPHS